MANKKIVCLGGGIGTVNLIKGVRKYTQDICVVTSMVDDGGSSGRLRRLYDIPPLGDLVSCMAAMANDPFSSKTLTYRFPGDRYANDSQLEGHKLGNLILASIYLQTKDLVKSIKKLQDIFNIPGSFYPDTLEKVSLSARTRSGVEVLGEESIDLGKYKGDKEIDEVFLIPPDAKACPQVLSQMSEADAIIVGPGDVYSNNIPVLMVRDISEKLKNAKAKKILIMDIANKPFEAKGYSTLDYINAFDKHIHGFPFDILIINNNQSVPIPYRYRRYEYVRDADLPDSGNYKVLREDLLDENFPLYHDSAKLAKVIFENI